MKTDYITLEEYKNNKGRLYGQDRLFDTKYDFIGWFLNYDVENWPNILVDKGHGKPQSIHPNELTVMINFQPIYEAV